MSWHSSSGSFFESSSSSLLLMLKKMMAAEVALVVDFGQEPVQASNRHLLHS